MEAEVSKLKDKWAREFDNLFDFSKGNIRMWTMDYANLNNNIYVFICEVHDELIEIEKQIFEMKIKPEITIPPLWDFISNCLEKQLAMVVETA